MWQTAEIMNAIEVVIVMLMCRTAQGHHRSGAIFYTSIRGRSKVDRRLRSSDHNALATFVTLPRKSLSARELFRAKLASTSYGVHIVATYLGNVVHIA